MHIDIPGFLTGQPGGCDATQENPPITLGRRAGISKGPPELEVLWTVHPQSSQPSKSSVPLLALFKVSQCSWKQQKHACLPKYSKRAWNTV